MKKAAVLKTLLLTLLTFTLIACDSVPQTTDDNDPEVPNTPDPLANFYTSWLTECMDFGGGAYNQLFAKPSSNGELKLGVLTWNDLNCEGTYFLSDFEGNPLNTGPSHLIDFEVQDVSGIPDNFFVLKTTNVEDSSVTYGIFYILENEFYNLSDYSTSHSTWAAWLEEDDVEGFVDDPANYVPIVKGKNHFNKDSLPDPLTDLHGSWLSDCVDLGGGMVNQFFSTFATGEGTKTAVLTWDTVGCMGDYTMTDNNGNPISEPEHTQEVASGNVSGLPAGFFVGKVTNLADDSILYAVIALSPAQDEFYELVPYASSPTTWTDWLLEDDVTDFIADPANYVPITHLKLHFSTGDLP